MSEYLSWFEGLCTALNSNPAAATPALTQFRSSDDAHSVCIQVLSNSSRSDVKFQALLILKFTLVRKWKIFSAATIHDFQIFLWNLLLSGSESMEAYVQNKLIQVSLCTEQAAMLFVADCSALLWFCASCAGLRHDHQEELAKRQRRAEVRILSAGMCHAGIPAALHLSFSPLLVCNPG